MPASDPTTAQKITVLKHLIHGRDTAFIAAATSLSDSQIAAVKRDHGYPDVPKMEWALDILEKRLNEIPEKDRPTRGQTLDRPARPAVTSVPVAAKPTPTPAPEVATRDSVRDLLEQAATSDKARTRNLAAKIDDLLDDLRTRLHDEQAAREEAEREAAAKAERDAEIAKLEARLAELKSGKGGGVHTRGEYPCDEPGCDFVGTSAQSRGGHRRYHHRLEQTGNNLLPAAG